MLTLSLENLTILFCVKTQNDMIWLHIVYLALQIFTKQRVTKGIIRSYVKKIDRNNIFLLFLFLSSCLLNARKNIYYSSFSPDLVPSPLSHYNITFCLLGNNCQDLRLL
jgi:hypothetical protein